CVGRELAGGSAEEHLPPVRGAGDPCGSVDVQAHVVVTPQPRLAGVHPHPDAQLDPVRPRLRGDGTLGIGGGDHALGSAREDDEETVAFGRDLYAAVVAEYLAEEGL